MTFLALTPFQTTLLAASTTAIVVALYFLKLRRRRMLVSSSVLWQRVLDSRLSESVWERLRRIISILASIVIALLIAMSIARPEIEWLTGKAERIVLVLDTSPTMNARTANGGSRWQRAVEQANTLIDNGGPATVFRIVDTSGGTDSPFTSDRREARRLIGTLAPKNGGTSFPNVLASATQVYFISDGVGVPDIPASVKRISVFETANNAGITAFEVRSIPQSPLEYEAYIEIRNYGKAANVQLTLTGEGGDKTSKALRLAAGEDFREGIDLSDFKGGEIRASIQSRDDALAADDTAFAYLPFKRKTRTLLVTAGNKYLETLLKLDRHIELFKTEPTHYTAPSDIDAFIFDRFAPPTAPPRPALIIGAAGASWLRPTIGTVDKPAVTSWMENHPVMRYVAVQDVSIKRAARIDASNLTVVAASKQTPLIVASEKPKWVMLTFDLDSSDLPLQVGFPVFVENVIAWFNRDALAVLRSPGRVEVPVANAAIHNSNGTLVPSGLQVGDTIFEANEPGLYSATTSGDVQMHIAVNLVNPAISNINQSIFKNRQSGSNRRSWLGRELWFYMLLGAIVLVSVEWFTYHRRITL